MGEGLWPLAHFYRESFCLTRRTKPDLSADHPTAVAFLDETGSIALDRFFGVGCLKLREPSVLLRQIQKLRDRRHWYAELHWVEMTQDTLPMYREVIDIIGLLEGLDAFSGQASLLEQVMTGWHSETAALMP
jgi:hypothetical protein